MADFTAIDLFGEIYDADDANAVQQSQVVVDVDNTSDDDHIPTAKAVYDAITTAPSDFYHNMVVAFPVNTTAITITPSGVELTADDSVTIVPDKPYTRVTFTDWANLNGADITNFTYIGQPADFSAIADMVVEFLPDKTVLGLKCLIETSGGDNHYDYYFYRVLEHETAAAYAGMDNLLFAPEWDMLSLYPSFNASNEIEGFIINGGAYPVKDPSAADQTLSNLTDASTARTNLGLGAAATSGVTTVYTQASLVNALPTISSIRMSNRYNSTETFVTKADSSVTGNDLYRKVFRATTTVNAGSNLTLDSATPYTDIVCMYASGKDSAGNYHSIDCFTDPDWCIKNTSGVVLTEVTLVAIYSKA